MNTDSVQPEKRSKNRSFSVFSFGKKKEPERARVVIGKPKNFVHVGHMGYNSKEGFNNITPEWREIFKKAGITEEQLNNKDTAKFLVKTIIHERPPTRGPPPPPPTVSRFKRKEEPTVDSSETDDTEVIDPDEPLYVSREGIPPRTPHVRPPPPIPTNIPMRRSHTVHTPLPEPPQKQLLTPRKPLPPPPLPPRSQSVRTPNSPMELVNTIAGAKLREIKSSDIPDVTKMNEMEQNGIMRAMNARQQVAADTINDDSDDECTL